MPHEHPEGAAGIEPAGEHCVDIAGVAGSIPAAPTIRRRVQEVSEWDCFFGSMLSGACGLSAATIRIADPGGRTPREPYPLNRAKTSVPIHRQ